MSGSPRGLLRLVALLAAGSTVPAIAASPPGVISNFEIIASVPAYGGAPPPGAAGPYQVITAIVHGALDPANKLNAGVIDLKNAPRDARGMVEYSTDVVILRPAHAADARRVLVYDVVNRGRKLGVGAFIGGGALDAAEVPPADFPSLLRTGATVVWSGWQGDLAQTGNASTAAAGTIGTSFPIARYKNAPITEVVREEFIPDYAGGDPRQFDLSYAPARPADRTSVVFTARQSWLRGYGAGDGVADYAAPSAPVTEWHYVQGKDGATSVAFTPPASVPGPDGAQVAPDAGTIYSFVYRARDPRVNGIGLAALRDLVAFLRYDSGDAAGHANPVADLAQAGCATAACAAKRVGNFDVAVGEGISQSGRFLKDFLYQGFNVDGQGRRVFDAMLPIIPGARRAWVNERFSQPGRWSKQHEDHWQPGDQFPFAYNTIVDPESKRRDGLLKACGATATCPLVMQLDGEFEWWGARAALVVTDGRGHDLKLPDNVRYYMVAGTQHGGGAGASTGLYPLPTAGSLCQLPASPVAEAPVDRAAMFALINWAATGKAPPASQYPTVAAGTLVAPQASGFPDLSAAMVPSGDKPALLRLASKGQINPIYLTDYRRAVPVVHPDKPYTVLVPKVDANGNATSGVLVPDISVPLATYTGWNLRGSGHAVGEGCVSNGAAIGLAVDPASKAGGKDSRATLAELYAGRADYQAKVAASAKALVAAGYLLAEDAAGVFVARAARVSPKLIAKP